jgi:Carboxypeptidase regulatory-like domain
MRFWNVSATVLVSLILLCANASPQTKPSSAKLSGIIVYKPESAPLVHAHIWIHEWSGKSSFETQPDRSGAYSIQLSDGYYFVLIGAPGFAPVSKSIWIHDGKPVGFSPRMSPDEENQQDGL